MKITKDQRKRTEANRLTALKRLNQREQTREQDAPILIRCPNVSICSELADAGSPQKPQNPVPDRFCVVLEICAPDAFSVAPQPAPGFPFPGEAECLRRIRDFLSSALTVCSIEDQTRGRVFIYKLEDYEVVLNCLKKLPGIQLQGIPWKTVAVVQRFLHSYVSNRWIACMPCYLEDDEVDGLLEKLPIGIQKALLPFQLDGVRFGLQRGGRCLLADEMGLGKTIQAIAIASCYMNEGPILVVCPAVLRFPWAEELERWLPLCLPTEIHLVFRHQDNPIYLTKRPKVVVISYTMLHHLHKSMVEREWSLMIVDESHNVRCTKKASETNETQAILNISSKVKRLLLLSGTPSFSRPGLLGKDKYEFANYYCSVKYARGSQGKIFKDYSNGIRLQELNVLLKQTVMVRRLKENVLLQLPPKRRQVIRLILKCQDIRSAKDACREGDILEKEHERRYLMNGSSYRSEGDGDGQVETGYETNDKSESARQLSYQELGIAKIPGFLEWFSNHSIVTESEGVETLDTCISSQKMIIFAHHIKVLDGVQEFAFEKGIGFVRIDGRTLSRDRQAAVKAFRSSAEVKIAIIGITAGGLGLDFSTAKNVVFVELPKSASQMLQAEDRAHRQGQTNAVNIYIFCAKDTSDEQHWQHLNKSLYRVSSMINGKEDAVQEIKVDRVCNLSSFANPKSVEDGCSEQIQPVRNCSSQTDELHLEVSMVNVSEKEGGCTPDLETSSSQNDQVHGSEMSATCTLNDTGNNLMENITCITRSSLYEDLQIFQSISANSTIQIDEVKSRATELITADATTSIQAEFLRFEVSEYTGRVHLYACVPGKDSRPRPLFENFRAEELELEVPSACYVNEKTVSMLIKENPAYRDVLLAFIKEWNNLRPIERNKLLGKPLQLPLGLELCYLKENINHESGGLLKGGSKRRVTPVDDINYSLPKNSVWKKISLHRCTKREKEYPQAWSITDEPLCKLCQTPCRGKLAKAPEFFEDLFCNLSCFEEYRIRTSQRSLREALFQIEHGICIQCKLDCHKLVDYIRPLSVARRREHIEKVAPKVANSKKLLEKLIYEPTEGNAWHADHIIPVYKGGGECRLENMRTLCVACHSEVTAAQRAERRLARIRAKEQLKAVIEELINGQTKDNTSTPNTEGKTCLEEEKDIDDELLITVPGSAYSGDKDKLTEKSRVEILYPRMEHNTPH